MDDKRDGARRADAPPQVAYFAVIVAPVLDDRVLADSAKLLYGRITSLADREGYCWATNKALSEVTGCGERTISRLIAQLEERGHIWTEIVPASRTGGRERRIFIGTRAAGGVAKIGEGGRQNWRDGIAKNGETYLMLNNKQDNNIPPIIPHAPKRAQKSVPHWKPERFEGFWAYYPRGENRAGAVKAWDKLKPDDALIDEIAHALKTLMATEGWSRGIGIPYAATFLNGRRWEDAAVKRPAQRRAPPPDGGDGEWVDL